MIVDFNELKEIKKQKETVVMEFLIGYYKDMQDISSIDIPYFIKAKQTYNELIHNSKDLKVVYDKVLKTRKLCKSLNTKKINS